MTAPLNLSVQYTASTLYIIFDRAVSVTGGSELDGFTFLDGAAPIVPTFSSVNDNAIIATLGAPISGTLSVNYVQASGTVVEAVAPNDPVASFSQTGVPYYTQPLVRRADVGRTANDVVTIYFSEPVAATSGDLVAGFTIEVNDVAIDLSSATATLNGDQTELSIDTGTNVAYSATVDVIYDSGTGTLHTWPSDLVGDFTLNAIDNLSTDGLPESGYPLSQVTADPVSSANNVATATLAVSLNPVDIDLVARYGPVTVTTGGTYGVTVSNPSGIAVTGATLTIVDGALFTQTFQDTVTNNTLFAVDAAKDWQTTVTTQIANALGAVRALDQTITYNTQTVTGV